MSHKDVCKLSVRLVCLLVLFFCLFLHLSQKILFMSTLLSTIPLVDDSGSWDYFPVFECSHRDNTLLFTLCKDDVLMFF